MIRRLTLWTVLWVTSFLALTVLDGSDVIHLSDVRFDGRRGNTTLLGAVLGVTFLVYLVALGIYLQALNSVKHIRAALETHPWRPIPAARKHPVLKDAGIADQFRWGAADEWSRVVSAVAPLPLHWKRWPEAMEQGAWYAGTIGGTGVLALPGGDNLMRIKPRP